MIGWTWPWYGLEVAEDVKHVRHRSEPIAIYDPELERMAREERANVRKQIQEKRRRQQVRLSRKGFTKSGGPSGYGEIAAPERFCAECYRVVRAVTDGGLCGRCAEAAEVARRGNA